MTTSVDKLNDYKLYTKTVGGVLLMTKEHVDKTNGFSNEFWGWGGEDDDMSLRIKKAGLGVERSIGKRCLPVVQESKIVEKVKEGQKVFSCSKFQMIKHFHKKNNKKNPNLRKMLAERASWGKPQIFEDGLNQINDSIYSAFKNVNV